LLQYDQSESANWSVRRTIYKSTSQCRRTIEKKFPLQIAPGAGSDHAQLAHFIVGQPVSLLLCGQAVPMGRQIGKAIEASGVRRGLKSDEGIRNHVQRRKQRVGQPDIVWGQTQLRALYRLLGLGISDHAEHGTRLLGH
jgi:hypothetical protein